ncbi:hypothetical protein GE09DRAFT_1127213 [Coniochaeta sp. 2T2.1]|nr:hypothetical protein GE09DRAFT_1127213 [Coniochaeta sp. 2T2.1]
MAQVQRYLLLCVLDQLTGLCYRNCQVALLLFLLSQSHLILGRDVEDELCGPRLSIWTLLGMTYIDVHLPSLHGVVIEDCWVGAILPPSSALAVFSSHDHRCAYTGSYSAYVPAIQSLDLGLLFIKLARSLV